MLVTLIRLALRRSVNVDIALVCNAVSGVTTRLVNPSEPELIAVLVVAKGVPDSKEPAAHVPVQV